MTEATNTSEARSRRASRLRAVLPFLMAGGLFLLGLSALYHLLARVDLHEMAAQVRATPWPVIAMALAATFMGYVCLAGYDWSALRYLDKHLPPPVVLTGGLMAYAFGNTLGLTAVSGGAVRWRVYSGLGLDGYDIAAISTFTALSFGVMTTLAGLGALALHPTALEGLVPLGASSIRLLALAAALAITVPLVWASWSERRLALGPLSLRAPRLSVLAGQVPISLGDLIFSSLTLYVLLPQGAPDFPTFMAVFAAATMAGVISHVPGGVGVFEAIILAAMPSTAPAAPVAAALLLYRLIYFLVPFALALASMALFETWRALGGPGPGTRVGRGILLIEPAMRAVAPLAPVALAAMTFGSGLWMSVSALLPPLTEDAEAAEALFPLAFIEGSALLASIVGAALIVLSLGVVRRSAGAFWLTVAAMTAGIVVALIPPRAPDQAATLALAVLILLPFRRIFRRRTILTHAALTPGWMLALLVAVAGFGFALVFAHRNTPYATELWWQFATDDRAPRAMRAGLLASLTLGLGALVVLLRAPRIRPGPPDPDDLETAARIAAASEDPAASFVLTGDKAVMLSQDRRAFIMFAPSGGSWVSYGGPVGEADACESVAFDFVEAARSAGMAPVFYEVGPADMPLMLALGMTLHKMGEAGEVDLRGFSLDGPAHKRLRAAHARALRDGLTFEVVGPPHDESLFAALQSISDDWLDAHHAREKGFSVGRFDRQWLGRWPLALVRHHGQIVAFANVMATEGHRLATIDLMRHSRAAPAGTMEFLFTALMLALKAEGHQAFSLGMAPLSGLEPERTRRLWDRFGALIYRHGGGFYNFAGLRAFKEKFDPRWSPHYLAAPSLLPPLRPLADATRLIARAAPA